MKNLYCLLLILAFLTKNLFAQVITSTNPIICGSSNTNAVLITSSIGTFQWSSCATEFGTYTNILGATTYTHITTMVGYYKVLVNSTLSPAYRVSNTTYAIIKNASGNTSAVNISAGQTTNLTIELYGQAPFNFMLSDVQNERLVYSPTNLIIIPVTPPTSRYFNIYALNASCGTVNNSNNCLQVNVNPAPSYAIGAVASTVCAGGVLDVPFTKDGTWDNNVSINFYLYNSSGTYISAGNASGLSGNTLKYQVPASITNGSYRLQLSSSLPAVNTFPYTPFFTVTNTGCVPLPQATFNSFENACSQITLRPVPSGVGYTHKWYKDDVLVATTTDNIAYITKESGTYYVVITNATGYNSTSATKSLSITGVKPLLTSTNSSICGTNTSTTILTTTMGTGYTYQWRKYNTITFKDDYIAGETNASLTVGSAGQYSLLLNDGTCSNVSPRYIIASTSSSILTNSAGNNNTVNLAPGQTENLKLTLGGVGPWTYTLSDGINGISKTSSVVQVTLPVSPAVSSNYYIFGITSANGSGCAGSSSNGNVVVNISPNPSFTFGTIATTACQGGFIQIPTTRPGNWGTSGFERVKVYLYTSSGSFVSFLGTFSNPTMNVQLPPSLTLGTSYKLLISPNVPFVEGLFTSNFTVSCPTPPPSAIIDEQNSRCNLPILNAYPKGVGYTFQWKKSGLDIAGATSDTYNAPQSGDYSVVIKNSSLIYNSTSPTKEVTVYKVTPTISCPNPILCGPITSATLTSDYKGEGFTYSWRKDNAVIPGKTGPSITVSDIGMYNVSVVNNVNCSSYSDPIRVSYSGSGTLLNSNDNNDNVFMVPPQTIDLKVKLQGTGPWEVALRDGNEILGTYTTNTSPLIIPVSPTSLTTYSLQYVSSNCGINSNNTGNVSVGIAPVPTITFPAPSNLTVCRGNTINIPYSVTGNIGNKLQLGILLGDPTGGESRSVSTFTSVTLEPLQTSGTIPLFIPNDLVLGSYGIFFVTGDPILKLGTTINGIWSNYAIDVVNTVCSSTPAPTISGRSNGCQFIDLFSSIYNGFGGSANTYQWYKDGVALTGQTSVSLGVYESGNYTVRVINGVYNQTSAAKAVTINRIIPTVTTSNPVICGSNQRAILNTNYIGAGYTYQWYKDRNFSDGFARQIPIFGQTSSSLEVNSPGAYSVQVFDGACLQNSKSSTVNASGNLVPTSAFIVSTTATAKLTNLAGDNSAITIGGTTTSATLRVTFTGGGPWSFDLVSTDGNIIPYPNVTTQVYDFTVLPPASTNYRIANLTSSCGAGTSTGSLTVNVSPTPSFTVNSPSFSSFGTNNLNTNICPGSTISIGYSITGNWTKDRDMVVEMVNSSTDDVIAGTTQNGYNTNPILYFVPYNVPVGTYKLKLTSTKPFIESGVLSNIVTVTNTDCNTPQATIRAKTSCSSSLLLATPSGAGFTYQWYNGTILIPNAISSDYNATADGSYTVAITNTTQGYSATSAANIVAIEEINSAITASSGSICNAGGSVTFTSNNTGGSYTHQWYSSTDNIFFSPISGATTNTYTATTAGYYNAIIKNVGCELKSTTLNTCLASLNFGAKTVCANSSVNVPFTFTGGENQAITIQLVDATTNAVAQANLLTFTTTNATSYNPTVSIPNTVTVGTYKFRLISSVPSSISIIGNGVLTLSNQTGGIAPIVSASASSVSSEEIVTITAIGCVGDVLWNNSDQIPQSFPSFSSTVNKNITYSATCRETSTGCISAEGNTTVTYSCADAYEPNNSTVASTTIAPNTFTSPVICLDGYDNPDWFKWTLGGHIYYIKAALASNLVSAGSYKLRLTYAGSVLTIETLPETVGQSLDTYLTLFDSDGVTILSSDDNGNANGFSKISFGITSPAICLLNESLNTGNWSSAGIWSCGHIPLITEPVKISTGHTVTLDVNGTAKSLDLRGILNKQATKVLTIQGN